MKKRTSKSSVDVWPLEQEAPKLTHLNELGHAHMVDVTPKAETAREAIATGMVTMNMETAKTIDTGQVAKGDVLAIARFAGIQAAKRAAELIPLCHPLRLTGVELDLRVDGAAVFIRATVRAFDRTGVEMEALAAVSAAALTVYDMCKAIDRGMVVSEIRLDEKRGGKSGTWTRDRVRPQVRSTRRKSAKNR